MLDSPALCPRCGSMLAVYEPDAGLYFGCDEVGCGWMSVPIEIAPGERDLEDILRDAQEYPDAE